jgi:ribosomal protein S6
MMTDINIIDILATLAILVAVAIIMHRVLRYMIMRESRGNQRKETKNKNVAVPCDAVVK